MSSLSATVPGTRLRSPADGARNSAANARLALLPLRVSPREERVGTGRQYNLGEGTTEVEPPALVALSAKGECREFGVVPRDDGVNQRGPVAERDLIRGHPLDCCSVFSKRSRQPLHGRKGLAIQVQVSPQAPCTIIARGPRIRAAPDGRQCIVAKRAETFKREAVESPGLLEVVHDGQPGSGVVFAERGDCFTEQIAQPICQIENPALSGVRPDQRDPSPTQRRRGRTEPPRDLRSELPPTRLAAVCR